MSMQGGGASLISPPASTGHGYTVNHAEYVQDRAEKQQMYYALVNDHDFRIEFRGVVRKPNANGGKTEVIAVGFPSLFIRLFLN